MTLHQWGAFHGSDKAKYHQYLNFYEERIGEPSSILEFGILNGASLKMWRDRYTQAAVVGMDIKRKEPIDDVLILQTDCTKEESLNCNLNFDLIIDDASHMTLDQVKTFELWWPRVNPGGHYIIEDIHAVNIEEYNPTRFEFFTWLASLGIKYETYWRDPEDKTDSGTLIFYK